jgi:hypothetical protein
MAILCHGWDEWTELCVAGFTFENAIYEKKYFRILQY